MEIRETAKNFSCQTSMRNFVRQYAEFTNSKNSGISRRLLIDLQDLNDKAEGLNLDELQLVVVN